MNQTTETAPATGADASGARKGGLNAMLLPELKQLAGGLGIKATGMRKGALIEAIKTAQGGGQSSKRDNDSSNAKQGANEPTAAPERSTDGAKRSESAENKPDDRQQGESTACHGPTHPGSPRDSAATGWQVQRNDSAPPASPQIPNQVRAT